MPEGTRASPGLEKVGKRERERSWRTGRQKSENSHQVTWCPLCTKAGLLSANILLLLAATVRRGASQSEELEAQNLGFINIDCGYDGMRYSNHSMWWSPDEDMQEGSGARQFNLPVGNSLVNFLLNKFRMMQTLRYFSQGLRNCYNISVPSTGKYLVRLTFWYNNYDGQGQPPNFNVSVGSTLCGTIEMTTGNIVQPEYIVYSSVPYLNICLWRLYQNPIISAIEIRPLPNDSYNVYGSLGYPESSVLRGLYRMSCGGQIEVERSQYPRDQFDRVWLTDVNTINYGNEYNIQPLATKNISTTKNVSGSYKAPHYLPEFVMQTARTPIGLDNTLNYSFYYMDPGQYQIFLYFVDWEDVRNESRIIDLYLNNQYAGALSISNPNSAVVTYTQAIPLGPAQNSLTVAMMEKSTSSLRPIISGLELYMVQKGPIDTLPIEVEAMNEVRNSFVSDLFTFDWIGDPCWPIEWTGVSCTSDYTGTKVESISVVSQNFSGTISPFIGNLTNLKVLNLADNQIEGPIPSTIGNLYFLETLELQTNFLNGSIPSTIKDLRKLQQLDLSYNQLEGPVPFNSTILDVPNVNLVENDLCSLSGEYHLPLCNQPTMPPPTPLPSPPPPRAISLDSGTVNTGLIAGLVASGVIVAISIVMVIVLCLLRVKRPFEPDPGIHGLSTPSVIREAGHDWLKPLVGLPPAAVVPRVTGARQFTLEELRDATGGFSLANQIGVGGFGIVFKGILAGGKVVAVKKRIGTSMQGQREFYTEVELLSRVHHRHLVGLVGFCNDSGQQILVYEYMLNGTVRDHLYDLGGKPLGKLEWQRRLSIALGAARGIEYLHTGSNPSIIHRDIKTSNILLDENYVAKVADFGLSKLGPDGGDSHVSTMVKGTAGYLDPEYYSIQQLTDRSDVYSFGVVLLELICAREPINLNRSRPEWSLVEWVRPNLQQGNLQGILDPTLEEHEYSLDAMWKVAEIGILCVEPAGQNRPSISDVLRELKEAMEMEGFSVTDSLGSSQPQYVGSSLPRADIYANSLLQADMFGNSLPRTDIYV